VEFFRTKYNREFGKRIKGVDQSSLKALVEYSWPGNIRQLESVIERAVILSDHNAISLKDIKSELGYSQPSGILDFELSDEGINFEEFEKNLLRKAMAKSNNVVARAAKASRHELQNLLVSLGKDQHGACLKKSCR